MSTEAGIILFSLAAALGLLCFVGTFVTVIGVVIWRRARRQLAAGGSLQYLYGNAPMQMTDTTLSQARSTGEVTLRLTDVARVRLVETPRPAFSTKADRYAVNQFFVVQVEDRRGDTIYVERLVTAWSIWGTRVLEEGSPVRAILQDLLPRLPPETDVDPRLTQYVATGALEPGS